MQALRYGFACSFVLLGIGCSSSNNDPVAPVSYDAATELTPEAASREDAGNGDAEPAVDGGASEASSTTPPSCVPEGTPNNELGVGGSCKTSADCTSDAGLRLCTADFGLPLAFCTTTCTTDSECGTGMYCGHGAMGSGCTPLACKPPGAE